LPSESLVGEDKAVSVAWSPVAMRPSARCRASSRKAASISLSVLAFRTIRLHPMECTAACGTRYDKLAAN
jgi:hypothetical protein